MYTICDISGYSSLFHRAGAKQTMERQQQPQNNDFIALLSNLMVNGYDTRRGRLDATAAGSDSKTSEGSTTTERQRDEISNNIHESRESSDNVQIVACRARGLSTGHNKEVHAFSAFIVSLEKGLTF